MADKQQSKDASADATVTKQGRFGTPGDMFYKAGIPVITALIGGAFTLLVVWLYAKEPHLSYRVNETVSFQSDKNFISITTFTVTNDGNKEAVDIQCSFDTPGVEDVQLFPADLHAKKEKLPNSTGTEVPVPRMIPGEELQVSIYFKNITPPKLLQVKVKCSSSIGSNKPINSASNTSYWLSFWFGVAIGECIIICYILLLIIRDIVRSERRNAAELVVLNAFKAEYEKDKAEYDKSEAERKAKYEKDEADREKLEADRRVKYKKVQEDHDMKIAALTAERKATIDKMQALNDNKNSDK